MVFYLVIRFFRLVNISLKLIVCCSFYFINNNNNVFLFVILIVCLYGDVNNISGN